MPKSSREQISKQLDLMDDLSRTVRRESTLLDLLVPHLRNCDYLRECVKQCHGIKEKEKKISMDALMTAILWEIDLMGKLGKYTEKYKDYGVEGFKKLLAPEDVMLTNYDPKKAPELYEFHMNHASRLNAYLLGFKDVVKPYADTAKRLVDSFRTSMLIFRPYESH